MNKNTPDNFLSPGKTFQHEGNQYEVEALIAVNRILARNLSNGQYRQLHTDTIGLKSIEESNDDVTSNQHHLRDLDSWSEQEWTVAQARLNAITPLLDNPYRTRNDAQIAADKHGVSIPTIYNWMKAYQNEGHISALIPAVKGVKPGSKRINKKLEAIIQGAIEDIYLSGNRQPINMVIEEVGIRCRNADIAAPHDNTIRNRIKAIPQVKALRARGKKSEARDKFDPVRGKFPGAEFPLSVVQIDHTQADVILVDDDYRLPLGRPWVTFSIDVFTRMVTGYFISPEHPSALATGMCVSRSILPKHELLANFDIPGDWPVWGKMTVLHADNGKDFRGKMLARACEQHQIDLQLRPVKLPHYGGHIERLMGITKEEIQRLPGTTFSNIQERKEYNSEKMASMTMDEFEAHLLDYIVNKYHMKKHSALGMPPYKKWELSILGDGDTPGIGAPLPVERPDKLKLDFMPMFSKTVQRYGIQIDYVNYYHESLSHWINSMDPNDPKKKRKFIVRRDPRDISKVYFYDPELKEYFAIPYMNMSRPAINIWELREARDHIKKIGNDAVDEDKIFETIVRLRQRVEDAVIKTKAARKKAARIKTTQKLANASENKKLPDESEKQDAQQTITTKRTQPKADRSDLFSKPVRPPSDLDVDL